MNRDLINQYASGAEKLRKAVAGLNRDDLRAKPGPGAWSIQELVIHVVDSDLVGIDRMKRVIAEDNPPLLAFDENRWIEQLFPNDQSLEDAIAMLDVSRRQMVRILEKLPDEAFQRTGIHSERGPLTLEQIVKGFVNHLEHHLKYLDDKRRRLGK